MATHLLSRARWLFAAALLLSLLSIVQPRAQAEPSAAGGAPTTVTDGETTNLSGAITGADTLQTGRIVRDGQMHGCEDPTAMPGLQNATPVRSDSIVLQNTHSTARCIVVEADLTGCAGQSTQVNGYSSYDPANPANNVAGATGFSTIGKGSFGFRVPAGSPYTIVVHEVTPGGGCPAYSIKVTNTPLAATVTQGQGPGPASITAAVDAFRAALGGPGDRREIDWENVPEGSADPQNLAPDYFNTTAPRGLVFTAPSQVRVSSDGSGATLAEFASITPGNAAEFQPYSGVRLFSPINAPIADIVFRAPGTPTPTPTSAFGAVLVSPGTTGYFLPRDAIGDPLGIYVPPAQTNGLAFYGLRYPTAQIHSMSIAADYSLGVNGGSVFDDFIYAEPGTAPAVGLSVTATGPGAVSGAGIQCPGDCSESYAAGTQVGLTAAPTGLAGVSWGGACAGSTGKTCALTMSEPRSVTATFTDCTPLDAAVTKAKQAVKKAKNAVKKAKKAVANADTEAELTKAKAKLKKAKAKLKKAKAKLKAANASLAACLG